MKGILLNTVRVYLLYALFVLCRIAEGFHSILLLYFLGCLPQFREVTSRSRSTPRCTLSIENVGVNREVHDAAGGGECPIERGNDNPLNLRYMEAHPVADSTDYIPLEALHYAHTVQVVVEDSPPMQPTPSRGEVGNSDVGGVKMVDIPYKEQRVGLHMLSDIASVIRRL